MLSRSDSFLFPFFLFFFNRTFSLLLSFLDLTKTRTTKKKQTTFFPCPFNSVCMVCFVVELLIDCRWYVGAGCDSVMAEHGCVLYFRSPGFGDNCYEIRDPVWGWCAFGAAVRVWCVSGSIRFVIVWLRLFCMIIVQIRLIVGVVCDFECCLVIEDWTVIVYCGLDDEFWLGIVRLCCRFMVQVLLNLNLCVFISYGKIGFLSCEFQPPNCLCWVCVL